MNAIVLLLDSARGVFIPRDFVTEYAGAWSIDRKDAEILAAGPEHDLYWETWDDVMGYAEYTVDGDKYILQQDGDLWAICVNRMGMEERRNFGFDLDWED